MKKIIYSIYMSLFAFIMTGCFEEQGTEVVLNNQFVSFDVPDYQIEEAGGGGEITVEVSQGATSNLTIDFEVTSENLLEGVDFELPEGNSVVIPQGEFSATIPYTITDNDSYQSETRRFTLTITSVSGGVDFVANTSTTVLVVDDDCLIPSLVGTFSVYNRDASPGACGDPENDEDLTYTATITLVEDLGNDSYIYEVSDVTGGLYALCYGDGENPGQFRVDYNAITLSGQPDVVYGGDEFSGTGSVNCDGSFQLSWSNNYGDRATSYYTPQ